MWMWMPKMPDPTPSETPSDPQIAHQTSGRLRLRLASWPQLTQDDIERRLRRVEGVLDVCATSLTHGILLRFDPAATTVEHLLAAVRALTLPAGDPASSADTQAASMSFETHAAVAVDPPRAVPAVDGASLLPARPAPVAPALPVYLTPLADVMAWANEAIAQPRPGPLDTPPAAPPAPHGTLAQPALGASQPPQRPASYLGRLLGVLRRLDTAALALKALSALAGMACAASPLALLLSLGEIAQLLVDLHLRATA